jgi:hypothetical protein
MEFTELIKISKLNQVTFHPPFSDPVEMSLCITGHHIILSAANHTTVSEDITVQ